MNRNRRTASPETTSAMKMEAINDPLCSCKLVGPPDGIRKVVPTKQAIQAADEAAKRKAA